MRHLLPIIALLAFLCGQSPAAETKPNFLLIVADDLCWRDLGFTGNKEVWTPNLDELRSQGMQFKNKRKRKP